MGQVAPVFGSDKRAAGEGGARELFRVCASSIRTARTSATTRGRDILAREFGHNDFYPVAIAAAQLAGWDGRRTLLAMLCLDEIRGRLAECFGLKDHKIDHVLHGGIASAAVYGAVLGATAEQIESAIGLVVAHYVPFRAIRHGHQLSDSKGASAAITAEMAVTSCNGRCAASSAGRHLPQSASGLLLAIGHGYCPLTWLSSCCYERLAPPIAR